MKYFRECRTIEDVKRVYRELAKKLHPDCGGDAEAFKSMQAEYTEAFNRLKNIHTTQTGETYEKETTETPEQFADIINKVIHFDGVTVEIIGSWIWLTGNTMIYREEIKKTGFWWSKSKQAWYYNGSDKKTRRRGRYSMDGLRDHWGAQEVKAEERRKLA